MKTMHKHLFAFICVLTMFNFYIPPAEAESHASSEATLVIGNRRGGRRGAWRRMHMMQAKQAKKAEKARQREHQRFENQHKARYQKETRDREMRLNSNQTKVRTYKWKKRN
ncbi:MAG: hypothetical protein IPG59_03545 [Candidatus Melainabacteria bacterium]|nr:MAG: hypothetical protein IPG59_03545 [Candidatus Melainabacteria bacterium]